MAGQYGIKWGKLVQPTDDADADRKERIRAALEALLHVEEYIENNTLPTGYSYGIAVGVTGVWVTD